MTSLFELNRARALAGMSPLSEEQSKMYEAETGKSTSIDFLAFGKALGKTLTTLREEEDINPSFLKTTGAGEKNTIFLFFSGRTGHFIAKLKSETKAVGISPNWKVDKWSDGGGAYNLILEFPMDVDFKAVKAGFKETYQPDKKYDDTIDFMNKAF